VTLRVVTWIFQAFKPKISSSPKPLLDLISRLSLVAKTRGIIFTVSFMKQLRMVLWAYLAGKPIKVTGIRVTRDGIPTFLGDLIPSIRKEGPPFMQVLNTILVCTRSLNLGKVIDYGPITKDSNVSLNPRLLRHIDSF